MSVTDALRRLIDRNKPIKLDICGGEHPVGNGFLNVDIRDVPGVDVVADARALPFQDNMVDEIFSCGTIEHFTMDEARAVLTEFFRVLKPGGSVAIGVPNLEALVQAYADRSIEFRLLNQYFYGAQENPFDLHKSVYDFKNMQLMLADIGYREITQIPYSMPFHMKEYMLEVRCVK